MKLNVQKTTYAIFTRSHKVAKKTMDFKVDGKLLQKDDNPCYLRVKLLILFHLGIYSNVEIGLLFTGNAISVV